ncbi:hypothetical protein [Sphingomonas sp. Marseille-Q8236]
MIRMPNFPWPPPAPSARATISAARFGRVQTLGEAADRLSSALERSGYTEIGYYAAPGGFALVTRIERMRDDGRPWSQVGRFDIESQASLPDPFTLSDYLTALLRAPPGRYRLIAFIVSDHITPSNGPSIGFNDVDRILENGSDRLDNQTKSQAFTPNHKVIALIYEFVRRRGEAATQAKPSRLEASQHLRGAQLLQY